VARQLPEVTPLVQPNPSWFGYSPPRASALPVTSYFSVSFPGAPENRHVFAAPAARDEIGRVGFATYRRSPSMVSQDRGAHAVGWVPLLPTGHRRRYTTPSGRSSGQTAGVFAVWLCLAGGPPTPKYSGYRAASVGRGRQSRFSRHK
jgi:hypothetical protein